MGKAHVSMLVLALTPPRHRIPLMGAQLARKGNSTTAERIALMERFLAKFGKARIALLLADREFVSEEWLMYLAQNDIPFVSRLRPSLIGQDATGRALALNARFAKRGTGKPEALTLFAERGAAAESGLTLTLTLTISAKRLPPANAANRTC